MTVCDIATFGGRAIAVPTHGTQRASGLTAQSFSLMR
jgi:hypothetical protein